ncbi:tetraspanin-18B-like [Glandiceps talaboti]
MAAFCVKALLFVINFVLWLIGSGLIGCTIYILVSEPGTLPYAELELIAGARALCYCVIALGALLFILGFLGCIGGVAEKKGMLKAYMGLLTTLFMGEVGMAVLIWLMESQVRLWQFVNINCL